MKVPQSDM
jgi:hypothetical protein